MKSPFKEKWFANLLAGAEHSQWRYVSADNGWKKVMGGAGVLSKFLGLNILCQFHKASGSQISPESRLHHTMVHEGTSSPWGALKKYGTAVKTMEKWDEAKKANDFSVVAPALQKLVDERRKDALEKMEKLGAPTAYDAVLDYYMPGLRCDDFERLLPDLITFCNDARTNVSADRLEDVEKYKKEQSVSFAMPAEEQFEMFKYILDYIGVDTKRAELGITPHPLCMGTGDKVGVGIRLDENDVWPMIVTSLHEGGHALYRQALAKDNKDLKAQIAGAGIDEAMALTMERHVGLSKGYAKKLFNSLAKDFNLPCKPEDLLARMNRLKSGTIRTRSDELRYPVDVVLRYKVEKALFNDGLKVKDLPEFWNKEYKKLTGLEVKDDRNGVLQDIHMYGGAFGWSPNYLYGQLAAAQISEAAFAEKPFIKDAIDNGDNRPMLQWLYENIYSQGRPSRPVGLVQTVTGKPLSIDAFKAHIKRRFMDDGSNAHPGAMKKPPSKPQHPPA